MTIVFIARQGYKCVMMIGEIQIKKMIQWKVILCVLFKFFKRDFVSNLTALKFLIINKAFVI